MAVDLVFNEPALALLLRSPTGGVGRDLLRRAVNVESRAKQNASGRPGPNVDTGRLRSSITYEIGEDEKGLFARIGTNVEYGIYLELGTRYMQPYPFLRPALSAALI